MQILFRTAFIFKSQKSRSPLIIMEAESWGGNQALDLVDNKTKEKLMKAPDAESVLDILAEPTVQWQVRGKCLRHPEVQYGCSYAVNCDIVLCPIWIAIKHRSCQWSDRQFFIFRALDVFE